MTFIKFIKNKTLILLLIFIVLTGCESVQKSLSSTYNMINCKFTYESISNMTVSGVDLSNGLSISSIPRLTSILKGNSSSIPVNFILNLNVNNPNQSVAMMHGLQYVISIDDIQFTTGSIDKKLSIEPGQSQILPLSIGLDLSNLMRDNSKDAVLNIARNLVGVGSNKSSNCLNLTFGE